MKDDLSTGKRWTDSFFKDLDVQTIFKRSDWAVLDGEISDVERSLFRWFDRFGLLYGDEGKLIKQSADPCLGANYQFEDQIHGVGTQTIDLRMGGKNSHEPDFELWTTITCEGTQEADYTAVFDDDFALYGIVVHETGKTRVFQVLDTHKPNFRKKVTKKQVRLGNSATLDEFWVD